MKEYKSSEKELREMSDMFNEYIKKYNKSPFIDIYVNEENDNEISIEVEQEFEQEMNEKFDNIENVMSDFITLLIEESLNEQGEKDEE